MQQIEDEALDNSYRHGDGSARILGVELLDSMRRPVEMVESGDELTVRVRAVFHCDVTDPVCGFLIRNRHGLHAYGTNTELQELSLGAFKAGEVAEISFAFGCWLGAERFSITVALPSRDGSSFDWVDDTLFFRVMSARPIEGLANLNASATTRRLKQHQHADALQ